MAIASLAIYLPIAGCVSNIDAKNAGSSRIYFGIIRVKVPVASSSITALDVSTLGAGYDGAAFIGWRDSKLVVADPAQCGLVVIIRSTLAAESAARLLKTLEGQSPCIADFTQPALPH